MPTRWINPRQPQTLYISQILLYFDAFWALLGILSGGGVGVLGILVLAGSLYGAAGIASELKAGYRVAVAVSFLPLTLRALIALGAYGGLLGNITWVLFQVGGQARLGGSVIDVMFQYTLIGLLLHQQSREHQKVWFE